MTTNDTLDNIEHPETRARLGGIQDVVYDLDRKIIDFRKRIERRTEAGGQCRVIADTLFAQCDPINKLVDAEEITPEEAKIRIAQIKQDIEIVRQMEADISNEIKRFQGSIQGIEESIKEAGTRFNGEVMKYERHRRMFEDDDDELGRSPAETQQGGNGAADSNPEPKQEPETAESSKESKRKKLPRKAKKRGA